MAALRDRLAAWRDRLVSDPRFQRWAEAFPPTRPIARRQSRALFDLCAGFVYSQTLAACVELNLFERLRGGAMTVDELSPALGLTPEATLRLLRAATALGLCERRGGARYGLGLSGAALLGNPGVTAMIRHHRLFYADLADPVALLRGVAAPTRLSRFWAYGGAGEAPDPADVVDYSALMAASLSFIIEDALEAWPFARSRLMLDIGGGSGAFAAHVARAVPELRVIVADLAPVAALATERFRAEGLSARAQAMAADAIAGPLPAGADLATFVRVLHDHDDASVDAMLRNAHAALAPGGSVLIVEPLAGEPGVEPVGDAYFGFYLLAMGKGRTRTADELIDRLAKAGFRDCRRVRTRRPLLTGAVTARTGVTLF